VGKEFDLEWCIFIGAEPRPADAGPAELGQLGHAVAWARGDAEQKRANLWLGFLSTVNAMIQAKEGFVRESVHRSLVGRFNHYSNRLHTLLAAAQAVVNNPADRTALAALEAEVKAGYTPKKSEEEIRATGPVPR
jgi:hypothetical protein